MRRQPVRQRLGHGRLSVCIGTGPHHRHEDLNRLHFSCLRIGERHGLAAIVDEEFLTGDVVLAHTAIDAAQEVAVKLAVLRVLIPPRSVGLVLVPQKSQGRALSLHLFLHKGSVWQKPYGIGAGDGRVKALLQRGVIQPIGQRPGQVDSGGPLQTFSNGASGNGAACCNRSIAQLRRPLESQDFSNFAHWGSLCRHMLLLIVELMRGEHTPDEITQRRLRRG